MRNGGIAFAQHTGTGDVEPQFVEHARLVAALPPPGSRRERVLLDCEITDGVPDRRRLHRDELSDAVVLTGRKDDRVRRWSSRDRLAYVRSGNIDSARPGAQTRLRRPDRTHVRRAPDRPRPSPDRAVDECLQVSGESGTVASFGPAWWPLPRK